MAEDDDISRRYRELPREEPPRHVDDAIRAAARRAVHTRPAPLVVPTGRQRWYFPLAAAAIIVLAVAVTMHVERQQPGEEMVSAPAAPAVEAKAEQLRDAAPPPELQKATPPAPAAEPAPKALARPPLAASAAQSPEQWLQDIADLRRHGRHEEADKSLAEFRKRYPDYPISKEVLEQVEKR